MGYIRSWTWNRRIGWTTNTFRSRFPALRWLLQLEQMA